MRVSILLICVLALFSFNESAFAAAKKAKKNIGELFSRTTVPQYIQEKILTKYDLSRFGEALPVFPSVQILSVREGLKSAVSVHPRAARTAVGDGHTIRKHVKQYVRMVVGDHPSSKKIGRRYGYTVDHLFMSIGPNRTKQTVYEKLQTSMQNFQPTPNNQAQYNKLQGKISKALGEVSDKTKKKHGADTAAQKKGLLAGAE